MTRNVGSFDRILRAVLGVALLALSFLSGLPLFATPLVKIVAVVIGVVMLATSAMRLCPLYSLLGLKTCRNC